MWHLPVPGIEPMTPALTGGFLSTVLPEKSLVFPFLKPAQAATKARQPFLCFLSSVLKKEIIYLAVYWVLVSAWELLVAASGV